MEQSPRHKPPINCFRETIFFVLYSLLDELETPPPPFVASKLNMSSKKNRASTAHRITSLACSFHARRQSSAANFNAAWRGVTEAQQTLPTQAERKNLVLNCEEQPASGEVVRF